MENNRHPPPPKDILGAIEAVIMVAAQPVTDEQLARCLNVTTEDVRVGLEHLTNDYDGRETPRYAPHGDDNTTGHGQHGARRARGFELRSVAGGWRIYARSEYAHFVTDFVAQGSSSRLSQAALETLAITAYVQPVSRSRISAIRGVNADGVVRTLVQRGLLTSHERDEATGSMLYSTTPLFLEKLGLSSLDELPPIAPLLPGAHQLDDIEE